MSYAFIFDIDDTIYDQQLAFQRAFENQFLPFLPSVDMTELFRLTREYGDETFSTTGFNKDKLRAMQTFRIKRALADYAIEITDKQALKFQRDFEFFQKDIRLFPEIAELFTTLVENAVTVGIITNGTAKKQAGKIDKLGLARWIPLKNMLISEEAGISKPEVGIFEKFEQQSAITNEELYYVGDNFLNDVIGAKRAGWKTIWANYRNHEKTDATIFPEKTVASPEELLKTVQELCGAVGSLSKSSS